MGSICESFNRINKAFGASRISLLSINSRSIQLRIDGFGEFLLHDIANETNFFEFLEEHHQFVVDTPNSKYIEAIAKGYIRDDEGNYHAKI